MMASEFLISVGKRGLRLFEPRRRGGLVSSSFLIPSLGPDGLMFGLRANSISRYFDNSRRADHIAHSANMERTAEFQ